MTDFCCDEIHGVYQSPIILDHKLSNLLYTKSDYQNVEDEIEYYYDADKNQFTVTNKVDVYNNGQAYSLREFHFHQPAEHVLNGEKTAMEIHFVFKKGKNIFVVGYTIKFATQTSFILSNVVQKQPIILPDLPKYFTYTGSLTTPPFNINVNWNVSQLRLSITPEDFKKLKNMSKKSREIQPRDGRTIAFVSTDLCN